MSSCEQGLSENGLQEISLQNRHVRLSILPAAGGKVAELVDRHTGRNWFWQNPHIPFSSADYDTDFGRHLDSGGWDEILLSTAATSLQLEDGTVCHVPDHGDVVGQEWAVVDASSDSNGDAKCEMRVCGRALNYEFRRTIRLDHDSRTIKIFYSLTNREAFAWPWYWCLHALVTGRQNLQIELPAGQQFRVDHLEGVDDGRDANFFEWPNLPLAGGKSLDLSRSFDADSSPANFASKIFVRSPESGQISVLATESTDKLTLRYDPAELPWLGLWINNGGWSGCGSKPYCNLGIEPASAAFDCVTRAIDDGSITWIQAGERREWIISVEIRS